MKKTILLVDDEMNILDIQNRYLLQVTGYDVLVAHDEAQGRIRAFERIYRPHYTDIMMCLI